MYLYVTVKNKQLQAKIQIILQAISLKHISFDSWRCLKQFRMEIEIIAMITVVKF